MFSPAAKKSNSSVRKKARTRGDDGCPPPEDSKLLEFSPSIPASGTPAPWASRLSVTARIPPLKSTKIEAHSDTVSPVLVKEFPQVVRDAQVTILKNQGPAGVSTFGGMDKETSLAWTICGNRLFVWNYLSLPASRKCIDLELPSSESENGDMGKIPVSSENWLVCFVNWDGPKRNSVKTQQSRSVGIIIYGGKTRHLTFWPDIYDADKVCTVTTDALYGKSEAFYDEKYSSGKHRSHGQVGVFINSLIASPISADTNSCIALACSSNGLWRFLCSPKEIQCVEIGYNPPVSSYGYPRSLIWQSRDQFVDDPFRQFLLLTDLEIQCFRIKLSSEVDVLELWSHEIFGDDDFGVQKGLAAVKRIFPLDMDMDSDGKAIIVLIANICKDQIKSSSYTKYSLMSMKYKSNVDPAKPMGEKILEKKSPIQVIIPRARLENQTTLMSMRLKVGGKPAGSAVILSGDGTATISHYWRNSTKLYHFDLINAGKVLDASIFPPLDGGADGAWAVLTEKSGVWVIPEKAVLLGGAELPEISVLNKFPLNDGSLQGETRITSITGNAFPRIVNPEAWDAGDNHTTDLSGATHQSPQDEDSEMLLIQLFQDFLISGKVDGVLEKLNSSRAFERDGEMNVFTRVSKSIVNTLAKHWTTSRGPEIVLSVVSTQLVEKQQKHKKYLHFLALSKCHEELCSRQKLSLQIIMEHGEKLAGMIQLRELQNVIGQANETRQFQPDFAAQICGAFWDLIQLVGERARRNTVILMDRENAEVFYSKVSEPEEIFFCLERQLQFVINEEMPVLVQFQRACELSNACVIMFQAAMKFRNEHGLWYPPPEGLTPWYSKAIVRCGLWSIASFMLQLLNEANHLEYSARLDFYLNLEMLSETVLESYSIAVAASVERKEENRTLLKEYWKHRDILLDSLYQQVKFFIGTRIKDLPKENQEDDIMKLSSQLLSVAKKHEAHQTMWSICCDNDDSELLQTLMHESVGMQGGFCFFVFQQLYESKQFSKLIRLGEEFQGELAIFLKQHPYLLWLHEIFLLQFSLASDTLHSLSLSKDGKSVLTPDDIESTASTSKLTLAQRKHYLNLAKISTMAGSDAGWESKVGRIEADMSILQLQEEILRFLPDNGVRQSMGRNLLPPVELIRQCLNIQNRDLSLRAFDIFASTSASFLRSNISLLEKCWRNAANQDDWGELHKNSLAEGWSDEMTSDSLKKTVLFQASSKCYGPEAEYLQVRFDEVLNLRQEYSEHPSLTGTISSVEAVIMQHKNFRDAGKLMLTAITQGSGLVSFGSDDRSSLME